jgi:hypothetical protein
MIATVKMIFAISTEMIATPPRPKAPATNAMMRKARARPNMKKSSALKVFEGITTIANEFCSDLPVTDSRVFPGPSITRSRVSPARYRHWPLLVRSKPCGAVVRLAPTRYFEACWGEAAGLPAALQQATW